MRWSGGPKAAKVRYRASERGKEVIREYQSKWVKDHPENKKRHSRTDYLRHGDKIRDRVKRYRNSDAGKENIKKWKATDGARFKSYRSNAKTKGIEFSITFEEFCSSKGKPCRYCGDLLDAPRLDRIDSRNGYTSHNVTPCCWECNRMKGVLTVSEFIERCERVAIGG